MYHEQVKFFSRDAKLILHFSINKYNLNITRMNEKCQILTSVDEQQSFENSTLIIQNI